MRKFVVPVNDPFDKVILFSIDSEGTQAKIGASLSNLPSTIQLQNMTRIFSLLFSDIVLP